MQKEIEGLVFFLPGGLFILHSDNLIPSPAPSPFLRQGDVLNFGLAVEKAKASGLRVEMVIVGDDVGVGRSQAGKVGRRGIAGTVLVNKIAGALAATG